MLTSDITNNMRGSWRAKSKLKHQQYNNHNVDITDHYTHKLIQLPVHKPTH